MWKSAKSASEVRVGCDVQSVDDVRSAMSTFGEKYLLRVLGVAELAEVGCLSGPELKVRYVSGRFAAKEAVYKLLRVHPDLALGWSQIEIVADGAGAPHVRLNGAAAQLSDAAGIDEIAISISHAASLAVAVAVALAAPT